MVTEVCCNCGVCFGMPSDYQDQLRKTRQSFYCPSGHGQSYSKSSTEIELEKQKQETERVRNQLTQANSEKFQLEGVIREKKRELKRMHNGVCPCCNRSFENLHEHLKNQHPEHIGIAPIKKKLQKKVTPPLLYYGTRKENTGTWI